MDHKYLAARLYQARKMRNPEEVRAFDEARLALLSRQDPLILGDLFAAFDDSTEQHEVMWGLVHDAESFKPELYLSEMAKAVPTMLPHAKEWASLLQRRVLNTKDLIPIYKSVMATLPTETRKVISDLLEEIGAAEPKFRKRIRIVLRET